MITLDGAYQYIGRSNGVKAVGATYRYYILLYAKVVSASTATDKHTVMVKMRLACDKNASFYNYRTDGSVMVDGYSAIAWDDQKIPASYWGDSASLTEDGVTYRRYVDLKEGTIEVPADSTEREVTIAASWQRLPTATTAPSYLPALLQNLRIWRFRGT